MTRQLGSLGLVLAIAAASCGGGDSEGGVASLEQSATSTTDAADQALDTEEAALAFTECLRQEGLDVEDPTFDDSGTFQLNLRQIFGRPGGGGGPNDEFRAAMDVCGELIEGIGQRFQDRDLTEITDDLLLFAQCMREAGVEVPDPDFTDTGQSGAGRLFGEIDLDDPQVAAAFEGCQELFGGLLPRGDQPDGATNNPGDGS